MGTIRLRHRARMREKEIAALNEELMRELGLDSPPLPPSTERAEAGDFNLYLVQGRAWALTLTDRTPQRSSLTVRGLLSCRPTKGYVTVDSGAVPFISNGADVMAPGIVEADPTIEEGGLVWVRDERNRRPLAVGFALVAGPLMPRGPKGKAVRTFHYVGDEIWKIEI